MASAEWPVWSTTARLVVTRPAALGRARNLVMARLAALDRAASRFRPDSELAHLAAAGGRPVIVSDLLARLVRTALAAADRTGGDLDPTVGAGLRGLGYDRDIGQVPAPGARLVVVPAGGHRGVRLRGRELTVPAGVELDLGATAKAFTADWCARTVARRCATGVLVSLGGDIATAGPAPEGGWRVLVAGTPGDPSTLVTLPAGGALATSSTLSRRWRLGDATLHHILDPRTGEPASLTWRSASVAAWRCVDANIATTTAIVRGARAGRWLDELGLPARLVAEDRTVVTLNGWPAEPEGASR
jgi:thiamine biosynthesis lipoprotein